jgi:biopolymer transport protein ExbB/TolQ
MQGFSISNVRAKLRGLSVVELIVIAGGLVIILLLIQYGLGAFDGWKQAREYQRQVNEQLNIAADEKKKREAAEQEAAAFKQQAQEANAEAQKWKGVSDEIRNQIIPAVEELGRTRQATAQSSQRYDQVRRAPRPVRPDDTPDRQAERLRAGAERFRQDND